MGTLRRALALCLFAVACSSEVVSIEDPNYDAGAVEDIVAPVDRSPAIDAGSPAADVPSAPVDAGAPIDVGTPPADVVGPPADVSVPGECRSNADCDRRSFCASDNCDGPGRCEPRPEGCATVYLPVCGCDGRTYGNTCVAAASGARVRDPGACVTPADAGTTPRDVPPVDSGSTPRDVPTMDTGVARDVPTVTDTGLSVCATIRCTVTTTCCDVVGAPSYGSCYPRDCATCCVAGSTRDSGVAADVQPGGRCLTNSDCGSSSLYCAGDRCGTAGTCATRPRLCSTLYSPVCGCDGATYSNECNAASAGARVASRGACLTTRDGGLSRCALIDCRTGLVCCDNPGSLQDGRCYDPSCLTCCR